MATWNHYLLWDITYLIEHDKINRMRKTFIDFFLLLFRFDFNKKLDDTIKFSNGEILVY